MTEAKSWKRCSACKEFIQAGNIYWRCSVSTCNQKRTALVFCSVSCWEVHLPIANHRESWAVEEKAPVENANQVAKTGRRRLVRHTTPVKKQDESPTEVLLIASRLKQYIRTRSGYNTSDRVLDPLSDRVREICDQAIENARRDGRMTVLDRDIPTDGNR